MSKLITVTAVEKTFTFAGISNLNGVYKVRFANKADRVKVLMRNGHDDIRLFPLANAMTKYDAAMAIKDFAEFADIDAQQAFDDFFTKATIIAPQVIVVEDVDYAAAADALEAELATA
jgi:hypothetical protein